MQEHVHILLQVTLTRLSYMIQDFSMEDARRVNF